MSVQRKLAYCPWDDPDLTAAATSPHYILPEQNLHTSVSLTCDGNNWYREPFPYNCTYHLPFLQPNSMNYMKLQVDPISSLVTKKLQWQSQMNLVEKNYKKHQMNFDTIDEAIASKLNILKIGRHEGYILHLLNHDPDPDFTGLTNWWYAGGRVGHMLIGGQMALLTSSGDDNEKLYVVPISDESKSWQPSVSDAVEFPTSSNETIYQIACTSRKSGRHNLVGVRQRNACMIVSLQLTTSNSFEQRPDKCWEVTYDEAAFTSLDFNPYKFSTFCTSTVNRQVSLWDSKKCCCVSTQIVPKPTQNVSSLWSSLQYIDVNTIVLSDPSTLMLLDLRQAFDKPSLVYYPSEQKGLVMSCEDIYLTFRSSNLSSSGRHFYCATSHHAFMFDVRGSKAVQAWTHMMRSPPIYGHSISMGTTDTTELICIANQEPGDVQLIVNNWCQPDGMARSAILPNTVPSLTCSRNSAQMSGQLLDPRAHSRMKCSIAGIACLPASITTNHSIVTQTSAGDVFVQELRDVGENITYTKADMAKFQNWEEHVLKMKAATLLKLSAQYKNDEVVKAISNETLKLPRYKKKIRLQESFKISNAELFSYKDILASKLLEAWDIDPPENDDQNSFDGMLRCSDDDASQESPSKSNTLGSNDQSLDNNILDGMQDNSLKKKKKKKRKRSCDDDDEQQKIVVIEHRKKKKKNVIDESSVVSGI